MKNFLRALRHAWPYRKRLILSIFCAVMAAVLWGANFTAIYPVLKLLHTGQAPQEWIDQRIAGLQKEADQFSAEIDRLTEEDKELEKQPTNKFIEQRRRDLANDLARTEGKLEAVRTSLSRYRLAHKYVYMLPHDCFQTLCWVTGLVVLCVVVKCIFEFAQESLVGSVVNLALFDLRNRFYRNTIHLDVEQFNEEGTSELMARFTNDMDSLSAGVKTLFGKVIAEPLRALACIVIAMFISWQLTLLFTILVPIALVILVRIGRLMKRATRRLLERMSSIYKILQESFQGIRVVKAYTMEPYERRRFCAATKDYYHKAMMVVRIDAAAGPLIEVLGVVAVALALLAGSYLVLAHQTHLFGLRMSSRPLEPETMLQLYVLLAAIADPVRKMSSVLTRLQSGAAAADRIFASLDRQPKVRNNPEGPRIGRRRREQEPALATPPERPFVELRDVCFGYHPETPVLRHINLSVKAGETVAVVGPNGCGKTTLIGLLPRFYDPNYGSVLVDGVDLRAAHLRALRQQIAIVTQEPILFDDTIYNNIAYGARGATAEMVEAAARKAFAHDFIVAQPQGYQTRVGERGQMLSGGQKQRLALARAILRDPAILILDEFTSQIDAQSEGDIHAALREFVKGRTTFLITHKMHTLEIADRIVVLDAGQLIAAGTHEELLANCPTYQRLHETQASRRVA
jgi:ATP-binding cassette subfamily B protein/subfamily B ATP-binding cassette protein MsbA